MTQRSAITLVKAAAILLLVALGQRGWTLLTLRDIDSQLAQLAEAESGRAKTADLIQQCEKFLSQPHSLTASQSTKLKDLKKRIAKKFLDENLVVRWPDMATFGLGKVTGSGAIVGLREAMELNIGIDASSNLPSMFEALRINGKRVGKQPGQSPLVVEFPGDSETATTIIVELPDMSPRHYKLVFRADNDVPQFRFHAPGRGLVQTDSDQRVGLKAGESVYLLVQDETLLRSVVISNLSTNEKKTFRNVFSFRHLLTWTDRKDPTFYRVTAVDWAGNSSQVEFNLGKWRRPIPTIKSIQLGAQDLTKGMGRTNKNSVSITLTFQGEESGRHVLLRDSKKSHKMEQDSDRLRAPNIDLGDGSTWQAAVVLVQSDREVHLADISILIDKDPPSISLYNEKSDPVVQDTVEVKSHVSWILKIKDNDSLDQAQTTANRRGDVRIPSSHPDRSGHTYTIEINGAGTLSVKAKDLAGNTATRTVTFSLVARTFPDDGKGPSVALWQGERQIPAEKPVFFWQEAHETRLKIEDNSGINVESLKLENCAVKKRVNSEVRTDLEVPVTLSSDPLILVSDTHGRKTHRPFNIQVVGGTASIEVDCDKKVVKKLPCQFRWRLSEVVPTALLSAKLIGPDGTVVHLKAGKSGSASRGLIGKQDITKDGKWQIYLLFRAFDGLKDIAQQDFTVDLGQDERE